MRSSREVAQRVEEQSHFDSVWCASNGSEKAWGIDGLWPVARLRCSLRLFCRRVTIPLAPLAARGNDIHGTTDFGSRGGKATARRLLAGADERARVPKR
jgi:hypothetical protein